MKMAPFGAICLVAGVPICLIVAPLESKRVDDSLAIVKLSHPEFKLFWGLRVARLDEPFEFSLVLEGEEFFD